MRSALIPVFLSVAAWQGANDPATATRSIDGMKTAFPAKTVAEGVKLTLGVVQSCSYSTRSSDPASDLKKAQQGDHVRLVFAKPVTIEVLQEKFQVSEVIFSRGVFWLRCGDRVQRCTKYRYEKMKPFQDWFQQTLPAN